MDSIILSIGNYIEKNKVMILISVGLILVCFLLCLLSRNPILIVYGLIIVVLYYLIKEFVIDRYYILRDQPIDKYKYYYKILKDRFPFHEFRYREGNKFIRLGDFLIYYSLGKNIIKYSNKTTDITPSIIIGRYPLFSMEKDVELICNAIYNFQSLNQCNKNLSASNRELIKKRNFAYEYENFIYEFFAPICDYLDFRGFEPNYSLNKVLAGDLVDALQEKLNKNLTEAIDLFWDFVNNDLIEYNTKDIYTQKSDRIFSREAEIWLGETLNRNCFIISTDDLDINKWCHINGYKSGTKLQIQHGAR